MKKLNKKGFTLVELLAVIAILAILMLLVTPNIINMFTSGRRDAFKVDAQSIWKNAETTYLNESVAGTAPTAFCNKVSAATKTATNCVAMTGASSAMAYYVDFKDGKINNFLVANSNYNLTSKNVDMLKEDGKTSAIEDGGKEEITCTVASGTTTCNFSK